MNDRLCKISMLTSTSLPLYLFLKIVKETLFAISESEPNT